jgi:hypothetical protein
MLINIVLNILGGITEVNTNTRIGKLKNFLF